MIIWLSPRPNLSDSSRDAYHDSDVGSWKPPLARLLVTGTPKNAAPTITSTATAMIRRGQCGDSVQHYGAFQLDPNVASFTLSPDAVADMSAARPAGDDPRRQLPVY
jgi:hypothetical protein